VTSLDPNLEVRRTVNKGCRLSAQLSSMDLCTDTLPVKDIWNWQPADTEGHYCILKDQNIFTGTNIMFAV
jgi:hypothetical protein